MLVVTESEVGKGYNADDLHRRQLEQLKRTLGEIHPTLHVRGVEIVAAQIRANDAMGELREEVVAKLGAEAQREAIALFSKDAEAIVSGERAKKRLAGNAADLPQAPAKSPRKS
jgi:hypothetical protein